MDTTGTQQAATATQAVLAVGEWVFGVSAPRVVQVVPCPADLTQLPRAGHSLAGVLAFRGHAVPVIDLRTWHNPAGAAGGALPFIAVLADVGRWVGLLVAEVRGLVNVPPEQTLRLHHDDAADEFFHSVATLQGGELLSLLDPARLMAQAQVWADAVDAPPPMTANAPPANEAGHPPDEPATRTAPSASATATDANGMLTGPYAVLRLGQGLYGLPTDCVAELIKRPAAQTVWGHGDRLLGVMRWRERDVALVNPGPELGEPLTASAPWVALLCDATQGPGGPVVALPCNGLERVERYPTHRVQSVDGQEATGGTACTGLVQTDDGPLRLLDANRLVTALAMNLDSPTGTAQAQLCAGHPVRNGTALVVFQARTRMAVPIAQLQSIEPLPDADLVERAAKAPRPHATLNWRGQALPLICLQQRLWPDKAVTTPYRRVLVTALQGQPCALLVGEVEQLIAPQAGQLTRIRLPEGRDLSIVTHELSTGRSSYELVDFDRLPVPA